MKEKIFMRFLAVLMTVCITLTCITGVQIIKVYATENESSEDNGSDSEEIIGEPYVEPTYDEYQQPDPEPEPEPDLTPIPDPDPQPEPDPEPDPQPDPFDYNLVCYTPSISFGQVYTGDVVYAKQFTIVNVGGTAFPLTWEEIDPYTAFDISFISPSLDLTVDDSVAFSIAPKEGLKSGVYTASYTFFSANDIRRHHTARVDVSITVKDSAPYITSVDVTPGSLTIPAGKSYKFDAIVAGGNGYDPSVIWSLTGNASSSTTIDSNGNLSVASGESAGSFAVLATSKTDPSKVGRAIVTVSSVDYMISVKADPSDGGAVAGGGSVKAGGSATASASPNNNYVFKGWYENGSLVTNSTQLNVSNINSDRNFVAKFERQTCYVRTGVNNSDGGTVSGGGSVQYGGKMTITAKAKDGYSFAGFVENNKTISTSSSLELNNITSDRNITAVFNRDTCNVNVSVNPQDTGKYEGAGRYNKGSKVELRASAYDGYEFTGWTVNGQVVSKDSRYVIENIKSDVNIVANFMKKNATTYKITSGIAGNGGNIVPSGDSMIPEGGSVTYNIAPLADYNIEAVLVDGKNIGAVSSYTFNNVKGGHTITASFVKKTQTSQTTPGTSKSATANAQTTKSQQKTEYDTATAAEGAVPEQKLVDTEIPEETALEGEEYEEDVYTEVAADVPEEEIPAEQLSTSVMARHNLDEATVRMLIHDSAAMPMLREAYEDGTLQITINNSYAEDTQETATQLFHKSPTLVNFEDVMAETLTDEEKYAVITGTPISFNINISENTNEVDDATVQAMQTKVGYKAVSYFDFLIMKTSGGTTTVINNTGAELEVVVPIPEEYQKEGRKFYVIRNHNGVVDVLENIGNDPTSVTFRTDRFSEYAIAYEAININRLILRFAIISIISLLLAMICFFALVRYRRKARRAARAAKAGR